MVYRILELYSGIGGMHCGWNESGLAGEISAAVDINTVANEVYKHNFPTTNLLNKNIQSLTKDSIKNLKINTILMSPPCQPFTRNGKCLDDNDPRTNSFIHLIEILDQLDNIEYMLMENVKGFECSSVRNLFIDKLKQLEFDYQEFLLSPCIVGVPNSRLRYYCIARRNGSPWYFKLDSIITTFPKLYEEPYALQDIIESDVSDKYIIKDKLLKRANIFDICYKYSKRSCCFTKAYSHYVEGTGSVFTDADQETVIECFKRANTYEVGSNEFIDTLKELKLRFFTPKEVLSLMSFPKEYDFPKDISTKQCYRLLGNSVNVKVISELLKLLFDK
ncbi:tRNA (cytosine(38)-C(5))-methyltransferase [Achroia grisella]|uniref:tRNA (cytosine(38)-C(5))-methyltransferase n=1 Tax=Achroia grisella TaxID=688607 RepID=UPI0027D2F5E1|nr:tRNA (cytosine(38)-C(5))-methyltransferase [Achroia grisella]XP_059053871.1 tRNA (cytosine(38)-C(5))-methyltransferase [Achroia grisella]